MNLEYVGLKEISGPLVVLEGVKDPSFEELVEITVDKEKRLGRIIDISGDVCVIQVFEGTHGISLKNTRTRLLGKPLKIPLSKEILGRVLDGLGRPVDGLGEIYPEKYADVNGEPINPVEREYPRNYIQTGISSIDCLATLIRGQKLPIFSGSGLPHNQLAVQIVRQAKIADEDANN
ncbi:MAG TPA: HAS-barrel domain-containing protein, partial [Thermoclostridium caenicola]|nr:HAS-barrel domain-containing protein [Thermoclostridium caenicola]